MQLGLIDVGYSDTVQAVIQNMLNKELILEAGLAVAQLLLLPAPIPEFTSDWIEPVTQRGGFGTTGQEFQRVNTTIEQTSGNLQESTPTSISFTILEETTAIHPLLKLEETLNPSFLTINNIRINLTGTAKERTKSLYELKEFENKLLNDESANVSNLLPVIQISINALKLEETNKYSNNVETSENIPLNNGILTTLLAADLANNKKISLESMKYYQNADPFISKTKSEIEASQDNSQYVLKNGLLCKKFPQNHIGNNIAALVLPDILLLPVIVYIHKYFLHPSNHQTWIEFASMYYHPRAKQTIKKVCDSCITCSMSRNHENKFVPLGTNRSFNPTKPRQIISIDILYMPPSSKGYTHGLLIADMFSLYLSFFPLKSKTASAVSDALGQYICLQGIPEVIYSDNDPSFRGEVDTLLAMYNIQHATSFPYSQKNNSVEANVRKFKNCYRAALLEDKICQHKEWHILYPLVIIRLNTLISKYGLSRELVNFNDILDNHLPIITESETHLPISEQLDEVSRNFKAKLSKFLHNKEKSKSYYKKGKKKPFTLHELVMRKDYTPTSPLHPTYVGPMRIIELYDMGVLLKDPKTGDIMSVHYQNIRKLALDEVILLLPSNFDSEILKTLQLYRYNRPGLPDSIITHEKEKATEENTRTLRSGKTIQVNYTMLPPKYAEIAVQAQWTNAHVITPNQKAAKPCLKSRIQLPLSPYTELSQYYTKELWLFPSTFENKPVNIQDIYVNTLYRSNFQSHKPGILTIKLNNQPSHSKKILFTTITVYFYEPEH